jgi:NaMN:DMB phosphoribosyltransferase
MRAFWTKRVLQPLPDLGMCLGEGTSAVLTIGMLASGVSLCCGMATFAEASVSDVETKEKTTK